MKNFDICFVIGAPNLGINHLSNIIRSNLSISNSLSKDKLLNFYSSLTTNAHIDVDVSNSQSLIENYSSFLINPPHVLVGHLSHCYLLIEKLNLSYKTKIIFIDHPFIRNTISYNRMFPNKTNILEDYYFNEQHGLYKVDIVSKLSGINRNNILDISHELFHSQNINLIVDSIELFLNLNYDRALIETIHTAWLKKIFNLESE